MNGAGPQERYGLLDSLRGLCLLSMILYHAMYDLVNLAGFPVPCFHSWPGHVWQQSICWSFILLSGMCWQLSHHPIRHGFILAGCGMAVTIATYFAMPEELILYGVLTLLGLSALLLNLFAVVFQKLGWKIPAGIGAAVSLLLFFLFRGVPNGYLGFEGLRFWELPAGLYQFDRLAVIGFPPPEFSSSDYFPLIPWFFLYLAGYFLWGLLSPSEKFRSLLHSGCRPLSFLGRHSLLIYLLHQPLLLGIFMALGQVSL